MHIIIIKILQTMILTFHTSIIIEIDTYLDPLESLCK